MQINTQSYAEFNKAKSLKALLQKARYRSSAGCHLSGLVTG